MSALAVEHKNKGNTFLKQKKFDAAIEEYTKAIELDPTQAVFHSNKAQAEIALENYGTAIQDATKSIELDPDYIKGYYRRAVAHAAILQYKEALKDLKIVLNKVPGDKLSRNYYNEFSKELKRQKFNEAIRGEDEVSSIAEIDLSAVSDQGCENWKNKLDIQVLSRDPKTKEQKIKLEGVTQAFISEMVAKFKDGEKLPRKYAYAIVVAAYQEFCHEDVLVDIQIEGHKKNRKQKSTLELPQGTKLTVCGDTHGQFYDLLNVFKTYGHVSDEHAYLFNGDFVDRGSWSTEVAFLLYSLKILFPTRLFLNRGNHETNDMNMVYGFEGECVHKYNNTLYKIFSQSFGALPLATLLSKDYLVMHGGLFSDDKVSIKDIEKIDRFKNTQPSKTGIDMELLWTDPKPTLGRGPSKRGIGIQFGPDVTDDFCTKNNLSGIIRSHEVRMDGFEKEHNGKLITVFSAPNYCDSQGNKGACIDFTVQNNDFELTFHQFEAVEHPDIRPMAYTKNMGF